MPRQQNLFAIAIFLSVLLGILGIMSASNGLLFAAIIFGGIGVFGPRLYKNK